MRFPNRSANESARLSEIFRRFAASECDGISALYAHLSRGIATDEELLGLCRAARPGLPLPNLLLASVHYLLLQGAGAGDLAAHYPSLTEEPAAVEAAFPAFRRFCLSHVETIGDLMARRGVVTSEVQRSACLLPGFLTFSQAAPAFHLIDVGAGAGFNLLWDRYSYDYDGALFPARSAASLTLDCQLRGAGRPPLAGAMPRLLSRVGIDLEPPNLEDPEDCDWLRALVWPEQRVRRQRLERAIAVARAARPKILAGDALTELPILLRSLPDLAPACVSHAFCLNQLSDRQRRRLDGILLRASRQRLVGRLALEWPRRGRAPQLRLYQYRDGRRRAAYLAASDAHGAWLAWRA